MIEPIDLHALASGRFRLELDPGAQQDTSRADRAWLWRIPCRRGFISVHGASTLAAFTTGRTVGKLLAIDGVTPHQRGDAEVRVLFGPDRLDTVADCLGARRRRRLSDDQRQRLATAGQGSRFSRRTGRVVASR